MDLEPDDEIPRCSNCRHQIHPVIAGPGMVIDRCIHGCPCFEDGCHEEVFA